MEDHIKMANKMIRFITKDFSNYHKSNFKKKFLGIYGQAKNRSYGGVKNRNGVLVPYITIAQRSMVDQTSLSEHLHTTKTKMQNLSHCRKNWAGVYSSGYFGRWMFAEYQSFHKSKTIGGFYSDDYRLHLYATIAHEIAHAVQHYCSWNEYHPFGTNYKSHGKVWRSIYSLLREKYINPYVVTLDADEIENYIDKYTKIWDIAHPPQLPIRLKSGKIDELLTELIL